MKSTFRILFLVRKSRVNSDGKSSVCFRVTIGGKRIELNTGLSATATLWDSNACRMSGRTAHAVEVNKSLDHIRAKLQNLYLEIYDREGTVSVERFRDYYLGTAFTEHTLGSLFDKKIEQKKALSGKSITPETVDKYICTKEKVTAFVNSYYKKGDISISGVDYEFISNYEIYLLSEGNCGHNTMVRHMRYLKQVTTDALKCRYIREDPFYGISYKSERGKIKYLTRDELERMMGYKFATARLEEVRDVFVFSCFTGLAYIDIKNLKASDIITDSDGEMYIVKDRKKTGNESFVPLLDTARSILDKYRGRETESGGLLPVKACQNMNEYIKEIAAVCGIEKNLSTHCGRHTCATMLLTEGLTLESVSKILGHADIKTTRIYAKVLNNKVKREFNRARESLNRIGTSDPA